MVCIASSSRRVQHLACQGTLLVTGNTCSCSGWRQRCLEYLIEQEVVLVLF